MLTRALHELMAAGLEPVPVEIGHMLARAAIDLLETPAAPAARVELAALIDGAHERSRLGTSPTGQPLPCLARRRSSRRPVARTSRASRRLAEIQIVFASGTGSPAPDTEEP